MPLVDREPSWGRHTIDKVGLLTLCIDICNICAVVHLYVRQANAKLILGQPHIAIKYCIRQASILHKSISIFAWIREHPWKSTLCYNCWRLAWKNMCICYPTVRMKWVDPNSDPKCIQEAGCLVQNGICRYDKTSRRPRYISPLTINVKYTEIPAAQTTKSCTKISSQKLHPNK